MISEDKENNKNGDFRVLRLTNKFTDKDQGNIKYLIRKLRYAEKYNNRKALYEILDTYNGSTKEMPNTLSEFKVTSNHMSNIIICKN
jgi:hypothetical protein